MSGDRPSSARDAAIKIILEELHPILERAEAAGVLLKEVREELNADLQDLGRTVQRIADAQTALQGQTTVVTNQVESVKTALQAALTRRGTTQQAKQQPSLGWGAIAAASLAAAVLASALVGGGMYLLGRDLVEQARLGRALKDAWSQLDQATQEKVRQALK